MRLKRTEDEQTEFETAVASLEPHRNDLRVAEDAVARVIVGQESLVHQLFLCLICGGNALVEGAPGLGKTLLVRTISATCGLTFGRVQFTPDLMPADITGTISLLHDEHGRPQTRFQPGPLFAQLVLADEINRATPKTQSALLEAMQEGTVTVGGEQHDLPRPFFVFATQNPIEMEGTYVLPEAQIDRFFFKVNIPFPSDEVLASVLDQTTKATLAQPRNVMEPIRLLEIQNLVREVPLPSHIRDAVVRFTMATQPDGATAPDEVQRFVRYGVSPRGAQSLVLAAKAQAFVSGRNHVSLEDVRSVALPALRHRLRVNYEGEAEGVGPEELLEQLVERKLH